MTFTLRVDGVPVPKGRARVTTIGGFARAYTPAKTRKYEELVAYAARQAYGAALPMEGPLALTLDVYMPIPKSWSKKKTCQAEAGEIHVTTKPDLDNFLKCVSDALNEICYLDDSQIVQATMFKAYSARPGILLTLEPAKTRVVQFALEVAA